MRENGKNNPAHRWEQPDSPGLLRHSPFIYIPGEPTNGVYGFLLMLFRLMDDYSRLHLRGVRAAAPTFRHKQYDQYKATRTAMPEDLVPS